MAEGTVDSLQVEVTVLSDKAIASLNRLKDTLNGIKRTLGGVNFTPLTSGLKQIPEAAKRAENAIDKLKKKCGGKMDFSAMLTGAANANKKVLNVPGLDTSKLPDPYEQSKGVLMKLPDNPLKQIEISVDNTRKGLQFISTLDTSPAVKPLKDGIPAQFGTQLMRLGDEIDKISQKNLQLNDAQFASQLDALKLKLESVKGAGRGIVPSMITDLQNDVQALNNYRAAADQSASASQNLSRRTEENTSAFARLRQVISSVFHNSNRLRGLFAKIAQIHFVRGIITSLTKDFQEGMTNLLAYSKAFRSDFYQSVYRGKDAFLQLKNSIAAAASPIITALTPAFVTLTGWIRTAANAINQFFAMLTGASSWTEALPTSAEALEDVKKQAGGASKNIQNLLASWDELNIIQQESGGGGGASAELTDLQKTMFKESEFAPWVSWVKDHLTEIKSLAVGVGAALLTWKISNALGVGLTDILRYIAGIGLAAFGAAELWQGFSDQLQNGVNWENLKQSVLGATAFVLGLGWAFSKTFGSKAWGIGLLIGGVTLAINPLKEFIETGKMTDEMLGQLSISLLMIGGGLSLLTGNWIPVVIAAVGVAVAWVVQKWDEIKAAFELGWQIISAWWNTNVQPSIDAVVLWVNTNVVTPVVSAFNDLKTKIRVALNVVSAWWKYIWENKIAPIVTWIDENIIQPVGGFFTSLWGTIKGDKENNLGVWWNGIWENDLLPKVAWIETNITKPIGDYFTNLWKSFTTNETVQGAISWFSGLWDADKGFAENIGNVAVNVTQKVADYFTNLWDSFKLDEKVSNAIAWFSGLWDSNRGFGENVANVATNITEKISGYFTSLWGSFKDSELVMGAVSWWNGLWGADGSIAKGIADINTNILTPIGNFFTDVWSKFADSEVVTTAKQWWTNIWSENGVLGSAVNAVNSAVLTPIGNFFSDVWANFTETETVKTAVSWWNGFWGEGGTFQSAISSVDTNVIQPIAGFFTSIWDNFTESDIVVKAKEFWNGLWGEGGTFSSVPSALESTIQTVGGFFTSLWSTIKGDEENGIGVWWTNLWNETFLPFVTTIKTNITDPIGEAFSSAARVIQTAWAGVENFFIGIVNGIIDGINWLINKLNSFNVTLGGWKLWDGFEIIPPFDAFGRHFDGWGMPAVTLPTFTIGISGIPTIEKMALKEIPQFGEGGFPEMGQMFIARERGAELVGEIGGRTAVANNEQIDRGIAEGVRDANAESNELLREQNEYLRQLVRKKWSLEPSTSLARTVKRSEEMRLVTEGI